MFYLLIVLLMGLVCPADIQTDPNGVVITTNSGDDDGSGGTGGENGGTGEGECEDPEGCGEDDTDTGGENGPIRPPKP